MLSIAIFELVLTIRWRLTPGKAYFFLLVASFVEGLLSKEKWLCVWSSKYMPRMRGHQLDVNPHQPHQQAARSRPSGL